MAKEQGKTNLYLLAIVAIVAVVGVVVLVMNSGTGSTSWSSSDYSGEAIKASSLSSVLSSGTMSITTGVTNANSCPQNCVCYTCTVDGQKMWCQYC